MKSGAYRGLLTSIVSVFAVLGDSSELLAQSSAPSLIAEILAPPQNATPEYFATRAEKLVAQAKSSTTPQQTSEFLMSARLLFGEGRRKGVSGTLLEGLALQLVKEVQPKVEVVFAKATASEMLNNNLGLVRNVVETLTYMGAAKEAGTFFDSFVIKKGLTYLDLSEPQASQGGQTCAAVMDAQFAATNEGGDQIVKDFIRSPVIVGSRQYKIPSAESQAIILVTKGNILRRGAKISDAISSYEKAVQLAPTASYSAQAYYWLALQKLSAGDKANAVILAGKGYAALPDPILPDHKELREALRLIKDSVNLQTSQSKVMDRVLIDQFVLSKL